MKKAVILIALFLTSLLQAQEADFRIMSFNMERGDLSVKKGWGWDVRKPAALAMLDLRHPDLLGVQECNSEQRDDILGRRPGYRHIGASVFGETGEHATSGNYIFYDTATLELLDEGMFWYAFRPDSAGMYTWIAKKPRSATWGRFRHKPCSSSRIMETSSWRHSRPQSFPRAGMCGLFPRKRFPRD